jgi:hypothetical protein
MPVVLQHTCHVRRWMTLPCRLFPGKDMTWKASSTLLKLPVVKRVVAAQQVCVQEVQPLRACLADQACVFACDQDCEGSTLVNTLATCNL